MSSILHQHFFAANIIFFCYGAEIELKKNPVSVKKCSPPAI